jgi:DNA-binding NtrC family response regulator
MPSYGLIADRFFQLANCIIDLASGEEVWLQVERERSSTRAWAERCAALYGRRHSHLVELVDYGPFGRSGRFEAFGTRGPLRHWPSGCAARNALRSCSAFLMQEGLSPGRCDEARVIDVAGRPRLLPDEGTGSALDEGSHAQRSRARDRRSNGDSFVLGIVVQPRRAVTHIAEFLDACWSRGRRSLQLCAPPGAGASTTLHLVAREARLQGMVPLATTVLERYHAFGDDDRPRRWLLDQLVGRHVVLLHDRRFEAGSEAPTATLARSLLGLALPGLQVAVVSVSDLPRASSSVVLEPFTRPQLLAMLGAAGRTHPAWAFSRRAVRVSNGWPGRFVRALGAAEDPCREMAGARERAPKFEPESDADTFEPGHVAGADLDGWKRLIEARRLAGQGRHASAIRTYRQAIGMCDRRGDLLHAGAAGNELGQALLLRGAAGAAREAFAQAGRHLQQGGALSRAALAVAGEAFARMAAGELREAEAILHTAELAALHVNASHEGLMLRAALLQCLHWQARWDEAIGMIERETQPRAAAPGRPLLSDRVSEMSSAVETRAGSSHLEPIAPVLWHCVAASVAIERRSLDLAARQVAAAMAASTAGPPVVACACHAVAIRLHGWIGDADAVHLHAVRGLNAARVSRAPMDALRIRMYLAAALAQLGADAEGRALALRLLRIRPSRIPPLYRAELAITLARVLPGHAEARRRREEAEAFARAAGASALLSPPVSTQTLPKPLCDIVDVVRSTHEYVSERAWLQRTAQVLRDRLQAASVAFVPAQDPGGVVVSVGGARGVGGRRAIEKGIVLGPVQTAAGIELAVPIRCGNAAVGALECRWSAVGPDNAEHARALVVATAAVSGPFVKSVIDNQDGQPGPAYCPELLGASAAMTDLRHAVARAAGAPFPVLITGESGAGKELVARAIHRESPRRLRAFATLNCAALTEELLESELFGHARGAFTGAIAERRGLFEEADGGTLFLDEVSELSLRAQAKLLRVLQEGEVRRVGESFSRHVEVRVVAATNRSLEALAAERVFRHDLRYRLDVIRIEVPPLRHRLEDVIELARAFWTRAAPLAGCHASLGPAVLAALARYDWPGNVRELQNVVSALVVAAPRRGTVGPSALPHSIAQAATMLTATTLDQATKAFERRFVAAALARAGGMKNRAAGELGITRQGLAKLIRRLGIHAEDAEDGVQRAETGA